MNAIVLIALRRPYTFVVLAILILLFGAFAVFKTPTDIFPAISIPIVAAIWTYTGLSPSDMSGRIVYYHERTLTTTVSNIEHIESQSYYGSGVVKVYFQPGTDIGAAQAQITASSQTVIKQLPSGSSPPGILEFDASSVPVLNLQIAADNMTPAQVNDLATNLIRPALISVPGVAIPSPYGGIQEYVEVDIDQSKLLAHGLSAKDIGNAMASQNIVLPAGDQKIGPFDYMVVTNATPIAIDAFNRLPIKQVGNAVVYLGDVAYVHRGGPPQQNIVLVEGQQAVLLTILKLGGASTLDVVNGVKAKLPALLKTLPKGVTITPLNDASEFVKASIREVVQEMVMAAILAGAAVLLFVGSWRSTLIVALSIPLSILSSIVALSWLGQTINVMTLGGLALAVGILVDDATVMIENINRHLDEAGEGGRPTDLSDAIIAAANQIVVPNLCVHAVHLHCMAAAVPTRRCRRLPVRATCRGNHLRYDRLVHPVLHPDADRRKLAAARSGRGAAGPRTRRQAPGRVRALPDGLRNQVRAVPKHVSRDIGAVGRSPQSLRQPVPRRRLGLVVAARVRLRRLFPWDQVRDDVPARPLSGGHADRGSAKSALLVNQQIRALLPGHVTGTLANCGLPVSGINQAYSATGTVGTQDCDITISLDDQASPVTTYRQVLRGGLTERFPGTEFSFLPGDITAQILSFGLPSPIDVRSADATCKAISNTRPNLRQGCGRSPAALTCASSRSWGSRPCCLPRGGRSRSGPG
jgi:hypothetical protein